MLFFNKIGVFFKKIRKLWETEEEQEEKMMGIIKNAVKDGATVMFLCHLSGTQGTEFFEKKFGIGPLKKVIIVPLMWNTEEFPGLAEMNLVPFVFVFHYYRPIRVTKGFASAQQYFVTYLNEKEEIEWESRWTTWKGATILENSNFTVKPLYRDLLEQNNNYAVFEN